MNCEENRVQIDMTADKILAIPVKEPGRLFPIDPTRARELYRQLSKKWHPDQNPAGSDVFAHITAMYREFENAMAMGIVHSNKHAHFKARDGLIKITFGRKHSFELGDSYDGGAYVTYSVLPDFLDLYKVGVDRIKKFKFRDEAMTKEMTRYLPTVKAEFETMERHNVTIGKNPSSVKVRDLMTYLGGQIEAKHVAWILSTAYNVACYVDRFSGLVHGDVSVDTFYVDAADHSGSLIGGWWYCLAQGSKVTSVPARTYNLRRDVLNEKAGYATDAACIRAMGRDMLGSKTLFGDDLHGRKDVPAPMLEWLIGPTMGDSVEEYRRWKEVLVKSYGPPKFQKLDIDYDRVYK